MRILALHFTAETEPNACQIYRCNQPLYHLGQQLGWTVKWDQWQNIAAAYKQYGRLVLIKLVENYDLFIFPRLCVQPGASLDTLALLFRLIRLGGRHIIYEVDDDFTNDHRDIGHEGAITIASWCDAVTVTTPYLADLMRKRTGRPTFVLPNMLDPQVWRHPEHFIPHEGLIIGLSGSITHMEDWHVLRDVLPRILSEHPHVRLRLTGFHPPYLQGLPQTDYLPPFTYPDYAEVVRSCDIILAPVDPADRFNDYKSEIKLVEGAGATRGNRLGAACIGTNNQVYQLGFTDGQTALLVEHTPEAWYQALSRVIIDEALRTRLQLQGHRMAWKRYDVTKHILDWARAYNTVLAKPALQAA